MDTQTISYTEAPRDGMPNAVHSTADVDEVAKMLYRTGRCGWQTAYGDGPGSEFCGTILPCPDDSHLPPNLPVLPDGYSIKIVIDEDYDPATAVDYGPEETAQYVRDFHDGTYTAYGVILVAACAGHSHADGRAVECKGDEVGSLWGCDVETSNADGVYTILAAMPDEYLREVAQDLIREYA